MSLILLALIFISIKLCSTQLKTKFAFLTAFFIYFVSFTILNTLLVTIGVSFSAHYILLPLLVILSFKNKLTLRKRDLLEYIGIFTFSCVLTYFAHAYSSGVDLNNNTLVSQQLNSVILNSHERSIYLNNSYISFFASLLSPCNSIEYINKYSWITSISYFLLLLDTIYTLAKSLSSNFQKAGLLLFCLYFVSVPAILYNFNPIFWLVFPVTAMMQKSINDSKCDYKEMIVFSLTGLFIDYRIFTVLLIGLLTIIAFNKKNYKQVALFVILFIGLVFLNSSTSSIKNLFILSNDSYLLPFMYLNGKQILVTMAFLSILFTNKQSKIKYIGLIAFSLNCISLLSKNDLLFNSTLFLLFNPIVFINVFDEIKENPIYKLININNLLYCSVLLFILTVSNTFGENPFSIVNRSTSNIFLSEQEYDIYQYINNNYSADVAIESPLESTEVFFKNTNISKDHDLIIKEQLKSDTNETVVFKTENYVVISK